MTNPKLNLEECRKKKNISQKQLAKKLHISQGYISEIEQGLKSPTIRMLYRIANTLEICPHMLLSGTIYCKRNNCTMEDLRNESSNL
ncbi:helix-turn-helix domain-containing protein [Clostridium neonatale]|uniref:helix-turn-helix domain-containing protein n=1 Tax=Clostridium neonatale TaxID=137838 RepID=UPI00291B4812|nr:Helix-turn-helix transcriptional regulator [Clostridium neonatale]